MTVILDGPSLGSSFHTLDPDHNTVRPSKWQWAAWKEEIIAMFLEDQMTHEAIAKRLSAQGYRVTVRMIKDHFGRWNVRKNNILRADELRAIGHKVAKRRAQGKETTAIRWHGRMRTMDDIRRLKSWQEPALNDQSTHNTIPDITRDPPTPSGLEALSPAPSLIDDDDDDDDNDDDPDTLFLCNTPTDSSDSSPTTPNAIARQPNIANEDLLERKFLSGISRWYEISWTKPRSSSHNPTFLPSNEPSVLERVLKECCLHAASARRTGSCAPWAALAAHPFLLSQALKRPSSPKTIAIAAYFLHKIAGTKGVAPPPQGAIACLQAIMASIRAQVGSEHPLFVLFVMASSARWTARVRHGLFKTLSERFIRRMGGAEPEKGDGAAASVSSSMGESTQQQQQQRQQQHQIMSVFGFPRMLDAERHEVMDEAMGMTTCDVTAPDRRRIWYAAKGMLWHPDEAMDEVSTARVIGWLTCDEPRVERVMDYENVIA